MKKLVALLISLTACFSLAGCADLFNSFTSSEKNSEASSVEETSSKEETSSVEEKVVTIQISTYGNDANVAVGGTKQIKIDIENAKASDATYEIVSGTATVSAEGVVTVGQSATVNEKITVVAKIGNVISNTLELTVVDAVATAMTLTPSATNISKGEEVSFSATFTPSYATTTEYTLSIEGNCDFAEIDAENILKIKDSALPAQIDGKQIVVKATLNANNAVFAYAFITVSEEASVSFLACETVNFVVNKDANKSIVTEAYSWSGDEMEISANDLTYAVEDVTVATVDEQGRITPKGHGTTVVTVSYGSVATECIVNVIVAPESISFEGFNTHILGTGEMHYAKGENNYLNLGVVSADKGEMTASKKVNYKFENLDDATATDIATVSEDGIFFNQTGRIKVTVISDSSVEGYEVNEAYEVKKSMIVNVNEGMNLYTLADLKEYAKDENEGKTANVLATLYVDDENHFGNENNKYIGLVLRGNRTIQGNGYTITAERLSPGQSADTNRFAFLQFTHLGNNSFSVEVNDLILLGNVNIEGKHLNGQDITEEKSTKLKNNYYRALEIAGAELGNYDAGMTSAILENAVVRNVTVKNFYTAIRYEHAISAVADKVLIGDCYANGIENCQSHLLIKDVEIQRVGAFGIEITPDDMRNKATANPSGTSGRQYNETATVRYEGYMKSANINNGDATVYMKKLPNELAGLSISQLVQTVTLDLVQKLSSDTAVQEQLKGVIFQTLMIQEGYYLNFSTLVFVNPLEYQGYFDKGNTENKFCEFSTTEKINVKTMLENCMANPNYNYKEKKYLVLDLADLDIGLGARVNLGQIIVLNIAYQGN